ncbi:YceI family protein [Aquimarina sp. D1M17]|uniref:YceI family protein n=1 Tax=Aquimarina acroporae TaxID=2937283 RepID=UPI0020BED28A|nr:YceI family protein [Aquimarina acroporae]MCK8520211.1 YceI family protein [Aquimarina acroporae]
MNQFKSLSILLLIITASCSQYANDKRTSLITTDSGLQYSILKEGKGKPVIEGQEVLIHEITTYRNNEEVYSSRKSDQPIKVLIGGNHVINGVDEGLRGMKKGEVRKLIVPPALSKRTGNITFPHPDSILVYEIELLDVLQKDNIIKKNPKEAISVNIDKSEIIWTGSNLIGINKHYGTVKLNKGEWFVNAGIIDGGKFEIDMNSIRNTDGKYNEILVDHLKNEDFFETNVYPVSTLEITKIDNTMFPKVAIEALLTIKGIRKPIHFQGEFENEKGSTVFTSQFAIDRTRWEVTYESKSILRTIGENTLSDDIEFEVTLVSN